MKGLCLALGAFLVAAAIARGAGEEPRRARVPSEYNARVQMHEAPSSLSDPRKPLPATQEPGLAPAESSAAPEIRNRPTPVARPIDPNLPEQPDKKITIPLARDVFERGDKATDPKAGTTGWGWLADEIATNRARRMARDADSESERTTNSSAREEGRTNQQETARNVRATTNVDNGESERRQTAIEPVVGWVTDVPGDTRSRAEPAPELDVRLDPSVDAGLSARVDWTRLDTPLLAPAETQDRMAIGAAAAVEESRRVAEPSRWILGGDPWGADKVKAGADMQMGGAGGSAGWQSAGFSPFSITPQEPLSVAPTPVASSLSLSPAPSSESRSLGGMGSERDRATPKTLPW